MTVLGKVKNGKVELDEPVALPEGASVRVEVIEANGTPAPAGKTLAERFKDVIGAGVDLPADLAKNHDHYLRGTSEQ